MSVVPDSLGRPVVCVSVTNTGTAPTTITMLMALEFTTWFRRVRFRPARTWVVLIDPALGQPLLRALQPGQQWTIVASIRANGQREHALDATFPLSSAPMRQVSRATAGGC